MGEFRNVNVCRRAIAADDVRLAEEEHALTTIVAGTNKARHEINRIVREALGLAGRVHEFATLARRDSTQSDRTFATNESPGDFLQPESDYLKALALRHVPRRSGQRTRTWTTSGSAGCGRHASIWTTSSGFRARFHESARNTRLDLERS
jgi:hypothetical protein